MSIARLSLQKERILSLDPHQIQGGTAETDPWYTWPTDTTLTAGASCQATCSVPVCSGPVSAVATQCNCPVNTQNACPPPRTQVYSLCPKPCVR